MKSKPLRYWLRNGLSDGRVGAAARWSLSAAFALGWLAALGWFASPGGSGGHAAPASQLGLVRLATQQTAPPSARQEGKAKEKPRQPSPTEKSTSAQEATEISAQRAQPTVASREAGDDAEREPSPAPLAEPIPKPQRQPDSGEDSQQPSTPVNPLGQEDGEISNQASESTAQVRNSDRTPPNLGQANLGAASREMDVAQLDAGFGLLRAVWPAYPALAKRLGKAGRVRLELGIDPQGRVYRVNVVDEISGWGFGPSAESAYRNARFTRPTVGGRPVRVLWRKTVIFRP